MIAGAITVSPDPFLAIMAASAVAGTIAALVRFGSAAIPAVVLELVFGVLIGPQALGLKVTPPISFARTSVWVFCSSSPAMSSTCAGPWARRSASASLDGRCRS